MRSSLSSMELADRALTGETAAIARMLTRAETGQEEPREALGKIYRHTGQAHIVGITGVPGSGTLEENYRPD